MMNIRLGAVITPADVAKAKVKFVNQMYGGSKRATIRQRLDYSTWADAKKEYEKIKTEECGSLSEKNYRKSIKN